MGIKKILPLLACTAFAVVGCGNKVKECETHTWDEGVITTEQTDTDDGIRNFTCSVCNKTKTEIVPKGSPAETLFGNLKEVKINSLYDGMVALYQTKNYTFEVIHVYGYGSYREEIPNMIFSKKFIGYDIKMEED